MLSFFIVANLLRGVERAQNAREELPGKLAKCLRLTFGRRQLSTAWDVSGGLDSHKCNLRWADRLGARSGAPAVEAAAHSLTRALRRSAQPWLYQRALVELARETGDVRPIARCVVSDLRRADKEKDKGQERKAEVGDHRAAAGGVLGRGACVWDVVHPLAGVLEELWCYQDWRGVSDTLEEEFGAGGAGRFSPFAVTEAVYGMTRWAQSRREAEPLARALSLLRLFYSRPGDTRRAVLLLAQPLAQDGAGAALRALLGECARAAVADEDATVSALGRALEWRLAGTSERVMIRELWLDGPEREAFDELRQGEGAGSLGRARELADALLAGLEGPGTWRRLGRVMSLAHMINYYPPSHDGFRLYWETVVRRLLPLLQSGRGVVSWAAAVALRSVVRSVVPRNGLLADCAAVFLFEEVTLHPSLPSSMACWSLADALDDPLRWELVARLGMQARSSPTRLRFATAALLSRAGERAGYQPSEGRLLADLAGDSDPVGRACAHWALWRLKQTESAAKGSPDDAGKGGGRPEAGGKVGRVGGGIAELERMPRAAVGEVLEFGGARGVAVRLGADRVGALLCDGAAAVKEGDAVCRTGWRIKVPVGDEVIGRVINPLGQTLDGKGPLAALYKPLVAAGPDSGGAPRPASELMATGFKAVDMMAPVGRGHCVLIVGGRSTGKTSLGLDTIINQRGKEVVCIYVAVGQEPEAVGQVVRTLEEHGAMDYTVVVSSTASDPPGLRYLAAYAGATIGRHFSDVGRHALAIYDPLLGNPAYDGGAASAPRAVAFIGHAADAIYTHALMLEQLVGVSRAHGAGSLTSLLVLDTHSCNAPPNVRAVSDGQLFLDGGLFRVGIRPAVDASKSTSRAWGAGRLKGLGRLVDTLRSAYGEAGGPSVLARRLAKVLSQPRHRLLDVEQQALIMWAASRGHFDRMEIEEVRRFEAGLLRFVEGERPELLRRLAAAGADTREVEAELERVLASFKRAVGGQAETRPRGAARAAGH